MARQSPVAIRTIKPLIQGARERAPNTWLPEERERFVDLFDAQDTREGVNAFLESAIPSGATAEPSHRTRRAAPPPEPSPDMNVLFEERPSLHGFRIGIATLDAEKSLNALSLPMIEALAAKLDAWAEDAASPACCCAATAPRPLRRRQRAQAGGRLP